MPDLALRDPTFSKVEWCLGKPTHGEGLNRGTSDALVCEHYKFDNGTRFPFTPRMGSSSTVRRVRRRVRTLVIGYAQCIIDGEIDLLAYIVLLAGLPVQCP